MSSTVRKKSGVRQVIKNMLSNFPSSRSSSWNFWTFCSWNIFRKLVKCVFNPQFFGSGHTWRLFQTSLPPVEEETLESFFSDCLENHRFCLRHHLHRWSFFGTVPWWNLASFAGVVWSCWWTSSEPFHNGNGYRGCKWMGRCPITFNWNWSFSVDRIFSQTVVRSSTKILNGRLQWFWRIDEKFNFCWRQRRKKVSLIKSFRRKLNEFAFFTVICTSWKFLTCTLLSWDLW